VRGRAGQSGAQGGSQTWPAPRLSSVGGTTQFFGKEPKKPVILCMGRRGDRDKCFKFLISYEANYLALPPYC
jgi:hypothetical protein